MGIQESGEMYLEAIYVLSKSQETVRAIDVSQHLGYSKPSVSRAMGILRKNGYLEVNPNGSLRLTDQGQELACKIYDRHTVLSQMLISLGVPAEVATEDACKMEHAISDCSFEAIKAHFEIHR